MSTRTSIARAPWFVPCSSVHPSTAGGRFRSDVSSLSTSWVLDFEVSRGALGQDARDPRKARLAGAVRRIGMLKRWISLSLIAVTSSFLAPVSTAVRGASPDGKVDATEYSSVQSEVPASRLARLHHGINLSNCYPQSADYSRPHLE